MRIKNMFLKYYIEPVKAKPIFMMRRAVCTRLVYNIHRSVLFHDY